MTEKRTMFVRFLVVINKSNSVCSIYYSFWYFKIGNFFNQVFYNFEDAYSCFVFLFQGRVCDHTVPPHHSHSVKSVRIRCNSGHYFPAFGLNTERYSVSLRIQCECRRLRTRITPNTDNFYAVSNDRVLCLFVASSLLFAANALILLTFANLF